MKTRMFAAWLVLAVTMVYGGAAWAQGLVNAEADAPSKTGPGGLFDGQCLYENTTSTETLAVTWWTTMTFIDGSSWQSSPTQQDQINPSEAFVAFVSSLIPPDAPSGPATFTCHADSVSIEGSNPGATSKDSGSDGFEVGKSRARIR